MSETPGVIVKDMKNDNFSLDRIDTAIFEDEATLPDVAEPPKILNQAINVSPKVGFFDLPGEIRNNIYYWLFKNLYDCEIAWCTKGKDLTHYRHRVPIEEKELDTTWCKWSRSDPRFKNMFYIPIIDTKAATQRRQFIRQCRTTSPELETGGVAAPLLACRLMYQEATSFLYRSMNFGFSSRSLLRKFMGNLKPLAISSIETVYVVHDMQGPALYRKDAAMKEKDRQYWIQDLKSLVANCPSTYIDCVCSVC
jgi:hypothetical protein